MSSASKMPRVMVVGDGQLGQALAQTVPATVVLSQVGIGDMDLTRRDDVVRIVGDLAPAVVINAAAYTAVDKAQTDEAMAYAVNEGGVRALGEACLKVGAKLIHVSTDYVFSGEEGRHLPVDAVPEPRSVYGQSKLAGERVLAQLDALPSVLVRTAWVYSNWGHNFLNTMLRLMTEQESLSVVSDQVGSPTSAWTLARALWRIVHQPDMTGCLHWTDAGVASWYDFALAIQEEALMLGLLDSRIPVRPIMTIDYPTPAQRPACALLDKSRSWQFIDLEPLHWRDALREVLKKRLVP